jgi:hypothetical protein
MNNKQKIKIIHEHVMDAKYIKPLFDAIDYSIENNFQHYGKQQFNSLKNQLKRNIKIEVLDYLHQAGFSEKIRVDEVVNKFTEKYKQR